MEKLVCVSISLLLFILSHRALAVSDSLHYMVPGQSAENAKPVHFIKPGDSVENVRPGLRIFCHQADSKYLFDIWKTQIMYLQTNLDTYELYDGVNPSEVDEKHKNNQCSFNWLATKKSKQLTINPFEDICIGVYTASSREFQYKMTMHQYRIDRFKVALIVLGIIIFLAAPKLSTNALFYYICGIIFGVTTSVIILIWFVSKLIIPRGKFMYLMVATGWTMSFYLAQALWDNAQVIVLQYREWVAWYVLLTSFVSFVICYRFGPVTNERTKKIIQWILQGFGLLMIYYSSHFREASIGCCVLLITAYNLPTVLVHKGKKYWKSFFPERRRLLTENEYRKEGIRETKKALSHLREFCSSPDCNQWKTVLRLKDPVRFAKFMEGDEHLLDCETYEHDTELTRLIEECEYTDDEDDLELLEDF